MPTPDSAVLPFAFADGWPAPVVDGAVTLRDTGILLGSLPLEDEEWARMRSVRVLSLRVDDHPVSDGWVTRYPDGTEENTEFDIPLRPTPVPPDVLTDQRSFEEWVSSVHGALGRLLVWDETKTWWMVHEPDLELLVTSAPRGLFSPFSDEPSWWSFGTEEGREKVRGLSARYGLAVPTLAGFIDQMHLLVQEQGQLFEFPMGAQDLLPEMTVQHGPWRPEWCSEVLLNWLGAGLLTVFADDGVRGFDEARREWFEGGVQSTNGDATFYDLAEGDARAVLAEPSTWVVGTPVGLLMCCPTEAGALGDFKVWAMAVPDYLRP